MKVMQVEPHFSWLRGFAIPALFTVFGVALGFANANI
jgi:hypothetical protein